MRNNPDKYSPGKKGKHKAKAAIQKHYSGNWQPLNISNQEALGQMSTQLYSWCNAEIG